MAQQYNIYCDETCHLEYCDPRGMVIGAVICPAAYSRIVADRIREVKVKHGLSKVFEAKWGKVSPAKLAFYKDLVSLLFEREDLRFRAIVIKDKSRLDHAAFEQSHDEWYYKMYYHMLMPVTVAPNSYRVYLDIKDTRSAERVNRLHKVMLGARRDRDAEIVQSIDPVRSDQVEQVQLADVLIGAISYANRGLTTSAAKLEIVALLQELSHSSLTASTAYSASKFNLFAWEAQ